METTVNGQKAHAVTGGKIPGEGAPVAVLIHGAGMDGTVMAQALVPFYSTKRGGAGLGLALVREITEAHGGQVSLAARDGGGTRVTLVLPG